MTCTKTWTPSAKQVAKAHEALVKAADGKKSINLDDFDLKATPLKADHQPDWPDSKSYTEKVKLKKIVLSKTSLSVPRLKTMLDRYAAGVDVGAPQMVCTSDQDGDDIYLVYNGNHRTVARALLGKTRIRAEVRDAD